MRIRVNVQAKTEASAIRRETLNGRDVIIVPAKTLPDNIIMNGILYPPDKIEAAYKGLERSLSPLNHPMLNGMHVSAHDPEGLNQGYFGAWNANVRRENGRVHFDKYIDVARAQESEVGRRVLDAIANAEANGTPIHTSTGIFMNKTAAPAGASYQWVANEMVMDHDAILLDEPGAATPDQGVGLMVNSSEQVQVVNSVIEEGDEMAEYAIREAFQDLERADNRRKHSGLIEKVILFMKEQMNSPAEAASLEVNKAKEEDEMSVDEKQFSDLAAKVETLSGNVEKLVANSEGQGLSEIITNALKPVTDQLNELQANQKAEEEKERGKLEGIVVNTGLFTKEECDEFTVNQLRKLAEKSQPKGADNAVGGFQVNGEQDEWADYDMNAAFEEVK